MSPTDLWRLVVSIVTVSVYDARSEYTFVQDGEEWSYQVTLARLASTGDLHREWLLLIGNN